MPLYCSWIICLMSTHTETCCCNHGGRCTCSHKKEPGLDTVPEVAAAQPLDSEGLPPRPRPPVRRRRAATVHSDGSLTFDKHGNYKAVHKVNKLGQKAGPYQLNRVNSMHSAGSLGSPSPDSMADGVSRAPRPPVRQMSMTEQRRVKSEATSPLLSGNSGLHHLHGQLPPLDLSGIEYPPYMHNGSFDLFGGSASAYSEHDGPIFSAGLTNASVDWSHIELADKSDSFAPSSYGQTCSQSFNGMFDYGNGSEQAPTLAATTSTSGEVSEVEDSFIPGDVDYDGFSTTETGFMRPGHIYPGGADLTSIDYDSFIKNPQGKFGLAATYDDAGQVAPGSLNFDNDPLFWGQQFNDGVNTYTESTDGVPLNTDNWNVQ